MDEKVLRVSGIAVGSVLMAVALWIAVLGPETAPTPAYQTNGAAAASVTEASASFMVRFRGAGPIARAQGIAASGELELAQRRIEAELRRQRAFAGLCFEEFTAGASEVVLRTCDPVAGRERAAVEQQWLLRLRGMRAVAYADLNAVAAREGAPG
jgi:hypothetical protein